MYYFLLALIDIGFYIAENWKQLTFTALASGIGMILGKRIGSRLAVRQIMKMLGLEKKSKTERQVEHHEREIIRLGGMPWKDNGATEKSWQAQTTFLKKRYSLSQAVKHLLNKLRRNQKMREYLKKLGSRKFQSFVVGFATQVFILLKVDEGAYVNEIAAGGLIVTTLVYIWVEGAVDKARGKTGEPNYDESDDVAA